MRAVARPTVEALLLETLASTEELRVTAHHPG
jgi:hypothetical protein